MSTLIEDSMTKVYLLRGENCDIDIWDNNVSHKVKVKVINNRILLVTVLV